MAEVEKKMSTLQHFNEALSHYHNKSFSHASDGFQYVLESNPVDLTAKFFLENSTRYITKGVPENRTGVEEMKKK
jgi:hypothetical protein